MTHSAWDSGIRAADAVAGTRARKVIVIGAGFAGLSAARALQAQGLEVRVTRGAQPHRRAREQCGPG